MTKTLAITAIVLVAVVMGISSVVPMMLTAYAVPKPEISRVCDDPILQRICKEVAVFVRDRDGQIEVGERIFFIMTIKLTNPAPVDWVNTVVKDRFGAELEIVRGCFSSQGPVIITTKGKSDKVFLEWFVGTVAARGGMATLTCFLQTDLNPAGHQEYTSPGEYEFNSGANVKFNAGRDGPQVSFETPPITLTVVEARAE